MSALILNFQEIDRTMADMVGGKGANLGELAHVEDINVPEGFCITTDAYKAVINGDKSLNALLGQLNGLETTERKSIAEVSMQIRTLIEELTIPVELEAEIAKHLSRMGNTGAYAVRSSATAEDLPTASFAGQQDTYLNVTGQEEIIRAVSRCWASLFTDRAVIYRMQNGFEHGKVFLSVVVQKMIFPDVSGIMFTADPLSSNRKVCSIDASFGLGEGLVSGIVNADNFRVGDGRILQKMISSKKVAISPLANGGTHQQSINPDRQDSPSLSDSEVLELEHLGRKIEAYFGSPQDIEWCLANNTIYIVQSRPITTLFPIPKVDDQENHVYVSVGHQQMMTDAMKPLGLSFFLLTTPAPMRVAAGRLFVDVTPMLASPESRERVLDAFGQADPLIKDALSTMVRREGFLNFIPDDAGSMSGGKDTPAGDTDPKIPANYDPSIVTKLIKSSQASVKELRNNIQFKSGPDLLDFILEDLKRTKQILFNPEGLNVIIAAMDAATWINEKISDWLGDKNAADTLAQSVPDNVTSEMGLALLDVADAVRPYPKIIDYLHHKKDDHFLEELLKFEGGEGVQAAFDLYLNKFGMRCAGEIDITKSRWTESPHTLIPLILSNIKNFTPGESTRKFEQGKQQALAKENELLDRLNQLPDGERHIMELKQKIALIRNFSGYREYPKYDLVNRYFIYKQAILKEAEQLVKDAVIREIEDIYYLSLEELREVVRANHLDYQIIVQRKNDYKLYERLSPPRVITSDGEIITGEYKREDLPADAIPGLAVSSGVIEGRARVVLNMEDADLVEGDILVTVFTDPSWTPLFVSIKGLVTEVGGLMTHGAVIAREYGLPAVVGIENATKLIKDGQKIRVNGTDGYVEILY